MKKIWQQVTAFAAGTTSCLTFLFSAPVQAASYHLNWQGNAGYNASGSFGFDDQYFGTTITRDQLDFLQFSFFDPNGNLLQNFNYSFPQSGEFNFGFDTITETVLQSGFAPTSTGFDLGIDNSGGIESGIDFYTCFDGSGTCPYIPPSLGIFQGIILQKNNVPQACFDINSLDCIQLDQGGILTATRTRKSVPESSSLSTLILLGLSWLFIKRKSFYLYLIKPGYQMK